LRARDRRPRWLPLAEGQRARSWYWREATQVSRLVDLAERSVGCSDGHISPRQRMGGFLPGLCFPVLVRREHGASKWRPRRGERVR
jgi:hypothetical protein